MRRILFLLLVTASACTQGPVLQPIDRLKPCTGQDTPVDAYCGTVAVYENRATKEGRRIDLNVVLLPAVRADAQPDPLFFLAGGPGQSATKLAKAVREMFRNVLRDRDIVLVDQRGTGKSNPLDCENEDDSLAAIFRPTEAAIAELRACMEKYDADLTQYTTTIAMDDLDDVRAYLGYERINIYGGSYGTRAGLVYMRQHSDRVRAAILDGVAPPDMRLPMFFPRDVQRAFDLLVRDCESDEGCRTKFPHLASRTRALVERLERQPTQARVTHPRTGETGTVRIDARLVANVVAMALYSPVASALVPAVIETAERSDFQSMLALGSLGDAGSASTMSIGMQLSVICAEDASRSTPDELAREAAGSLFGGHVMRVQRDACAFWPRARVEDSFYEPLTSSIPTLVLSGELDPVTPPSWGNDVASHLSASKHVVIPGTGHTAGGTSCGQRIMQYFIETGSTTNLDTSCVERITRPPFFVTPAGPDPTRGARP